MSGFEVAGIVLGAFPIAIWALEQYRDVARRVGFWYEIRLEYQKSSNELKYHHISFVRNLKQLLLPVVSDDAQLQRLMAEPGGDAWKDPATIKLLETRLQDSCGLYLEIIGEMKVVMEELNKELAVDVEGVQNAWTDKLGTASTKPSTTSTIKSRLDRGNREYQLFRVKFSMGERPRARLFAELQTYNERLEKLTATSDIVTKLQADNQASRPPGSIVDVAICKFWHHANALYKALHGAWNCNCRYQHFARLILQHRTSVDKEFHLLFAPDTHADGGPSSWPNCPVKIKMLEAPKHVAAIEHTMASVHISTPQHRTRAPARGALAGTAQGRTPARQTVALNTQAAKTSQTVPSLTITLTTPVGQSSPAVIHASSSSRITSLCHTLNNGIVTPPDKQCSGYLESEDIRYELYMESNALNMCCDPSQPNISLSQILSGEMPRPLSRRQRYGLSVTLASSFVQLKNTPWLHSSWSKRSVQFPHGAVGGRAALLLDTPFVSGDFAASTALPDAAEGGNDDYVAGIASLGIVLLELCFGRVIEQHPSRLKLPAGEGPQIHAALDLLAALEWLKEVNDEAGADFAEAIGWCLVGCRTMSGGGGGTWRRQMLEKVVVPLDRCYKYLVSS